MNTVVQLTKSALKGFKNAPSHVQSKFQAWADRVESAGLVAANQSPGYREERLQGQRQGDYSIRLNKQWRVLYQVRADNTLVVVNVMEITPHDYRLR